MKLCKLALLSLFVFGAMYAQKVNLSVNDSRLSPRLLNYQGYLTDDQGIPITNPSLSMTFGIWSALSGGSQIWYETQTVGVSKGIFNAILGSNTAIPDSIFTKSTDRWLEITVGGITLSPRTRITSVGYAYTSTYSDTALYAKSIVAGNYWVFRITDSADTTLQMGGRWGLSRMGNTMYGNADSTHVNFGVACTTGTWDQNIKYCTVGGGKNNNACGPYTTVGGGYKNLANEWYATVCGGDSNFANYFGTVGGGHQNAAWDYATVGGGWCNNASGSHATVSGGWYNIAGYDCATVCGGDSNIAFDYAFIGSGSKNKAYTYATVGGGAFNLAGGTCSAIVGGYADTITWDCDYSYLFGINSNLTQDSTFMVDMPHIRFGDETNGYEFPTADGSSGQVMMTDGSGQLSWGTPAKTGGSFTIDHPLEPETKILNHYFIEGPEMRNIYEGSAVLDASGKTGVILPDYFNTLNRDPHVQLTGVGTSDVYVAEEIQGNRFVIGGKPGTKVYWQVTGERNDQSAEIIRIIMPVEQHKSDGLAGRSLDDDFLVSTMEQLERMGKSDGFKFRHASNQQRYEEMKQRLNNK